MSGITAAKTHHFALHLVSLEGGADFVRLFPRAQPWVGVIIPKRWARRAVTRNTIRRQIYELARAAQGSLPRAAMVVRLRSEFSRKRFISATSDVLKAAVRAELLSLYRQVQRPNPAEEPSHAG